MIGLFSARVSLPNDAFLEILFDIPHHPLVVNRQYHQEDYIQHPQFLGIGEGEDSLVSQYLVSRGLGLRS